MVMEWLALASFVVGAYGTWQSGEIADAQADAQAEQWAMNTRMGQLRAQQTIMDLRRSFRYTAGMSLASMGHGAAGIGESFLALRADEHNVLSKDIENANLGFLSEAAQGGLATNVARARAQNQKLMSYAGLVNQGLQGYVDYKLLST